MLRLIKIFTVVIIIAGCSDNPTSEDENDNGTDPDMTVTGSIIRVPADAATIQMALDSALDGDTILLADGTYSDMWNCDLTITGKSIVIKSENGPDKTIIDCEGDSLNIHFAFNIKFAATSNTIIDGITFKNGYTNQGSAIHFTSTSPTVKNCVFQDNIATISGGAVRCKGSSPVFINCTFFNNQSPTGAAVLLIANSQPTFENCIIAYSKEGKAIHCIEGTSIPTLICCDLFGNEGGDWIDRIADQYDSLTNLNGNLMVNPLFCDTIGDNFAIRNSSSCNPDNNSCDELIGALPVGCSDGTGI